MRQANWHGRGWCSPSSVPRKRVRDPRGRCPFNVVRPNPRTEPPGSGFGSWGYNAECRPLRAGAFPTKRSELHSVIEKLLRSLLSHYRYGGAHAADQSSPSRQIPHANRIGEPLGGVPQVQSVRRPPSGRAERWYASAQFGGPSLSADAISASARSKSVRADNAFLLPAARRSAGLRLRGRCGARRARKSHLGMTSCIKRSQNRRKVSADAWMEYTYFCGLFTGRLATYCV